MQVSIVNAPKDSVIETEDAALVVRKRGHYTSFQRILLVGEGDFSFSLSLAWAFGSANKMVATSLDSEACLAYKYSSATSNVERLRESGCRVLHGIDATEMSRDLRLSAMKFDRIVFNFPHAGFIFPETRAAQIKLHKDLLEGFFRNARDLLHHEHGEVQVTHKQGYPYSKWELEETAEFGFVLVKASPFSLSDYPGYINKRGSGSHPGRTFPVGSTSTFMFKIDAGFPDFPDLGSSPLIDEILAEGGNEDTGPAITALGNEDVGPTFDTTFEAADNKSKVAEDESTLILKIEIPNLLIDSVDTPFD